MHPSFFDGFQGREGTPAVGTNGLSDRKIGGAISRLVPITEPLEMLHSRDSHHRTSG